MGMSEKGDIQYLKETYHPDFSLLLNVGTAHVGNTGSLENTFLEKRNIFTKTKPGYEEYVKITSAFIPWVPKSKED